MNKRIMSELFLLWILTLIGMAAGAANLPILLDQGKTHTISLMKIQPNTETGMADAYFSLKKEKKIGNFTVKNTNVITSIETCSATADICVGDQLEIVPDNGEKYQKYVLPINPDTLVDGAFDAPGVSYVLFVYYQLCLRDSESCVENSGYMAINIPREMLIDGKRHIGRTLLQEPI